MEDVKALGEKFVRVCVSVIVHLARGIRLRSARGGGAAGGSGAGAPLADVWAECRHLPAFYCISQHNSAIYTRLGRFQGIW